MEFRGRDDYIKTLLQDIMGSFKSPEYRIAMFTMLASPGVGKTRVFAEFVKMSSADMKNIVDDKSLDKVTETTLNIVVSFGEHAPYRTEEESIDVIKFSLIFRILWIWLTDKSDISHVYDVIASYQKSGRLHIFDLSLSSVLELMSKRSGKKNFNVFVDDLFISTPKDVANEQLRTMSYAPETELPGLALRMIFSCRSCEPFDHLFKYKFRPHHSPLFDLIEKSSTRSIVSASMKERRDDCPKGRFELPDEIMVNIITLLCGGHMRTCKILIETMSGMRSANEVLSYIESASNAYKKIYTNNVRGAVVVCMLGYYILSNTLIRNSLNEEFTTAGMMLSNGQLMSAYSVSDVASYLQPRMPLLSLFQWALETCDNQNAGEGSELAKCIVKLLHIATCRGTTNRLKYTSACIMRHMIMRHVYNDLMDGIRQGWTGVMQN